MNEAMFPWRWEEGARSARVVSPSSSCSTPESSGSEAGTSGNDHHRRGRPRSDNLISLQVQGSASSNRIQCHICSRVFPREKSLQAHMRTHTGERPYICDFPNCNKAFCQSGQLKTHQRLHTGEKPFVCSVEGCSSRFTHANRRCSQHPVAPLRREKISAPTIPYLSAPDQCDKVMKWLARHTALRQETTPSKSKARKFKREMEERAKLQHIEARKRAKDIAKNNRLDERKIRAREQQEAIRDITSEEKHWVNEQKNLVNDQNAWVTKSKNLVNGQNDWICEPKDEVIEQRDKLISALALIELARGIM